MIGRQKGQAISRKGVDSVFVEEETRKSNLILEANLLKEQGRHQEAADRFAEAAQIEEHLSEMLAEKGLIDKYFVHRFSAASCWAQAGNIYQAIVMCEELLARSDLPEGLRQRIQEHLQILRARREQWFVSLVPDVAAAVTLEG
jgi:tetratricopeptide (TPR) repeat protein